MFRKFFSKILDLFSKKRVNRSERWDKRDRGEGFRYIPLFSKRGIAILVLTYLGVVYLVQLATIVTSELVYQTSKIGYVPAP